MTGPDVAAPRDILADSLGGGWPQADAALDALDRAGYAVVAKVWVAQLELIEHRGGWIGVYVTPEGAAAALVKWARDVGVPIEHYDPATGSEILDEHPEIETYGVSYVEVQR
ncbi:Uncharacterised protein [Mycobacteroides abscessus subsp. abscessus]|uniref:hypothetical protein n=1 Tax=Mycobacteroides abscessus TaxID=36809 RepID=UPI0009A88C85|nr:hypothetical protein [Mycobacteroides abscessus]SKU30429.1 Uncharacterised protein [Mycobacteroides abscessus subsp. abscessus]